MVFQGRLGLGVLDTEARRDVLQRQVQLIVADFLGRASEVRAAQAAGAFDSLFVTADGRLVEGGRSSVFVKLDDRWWTPPVSDGALPGVMRGLLLEDVVCYAAASTEIYARRHSLSLLVARPV